MADDNRAKLLQHGPNPREEARQYIVERISTSPSLFDFVLHHLAISNLYSEGVTWGMIGKPYTPENYLELAYTGDLKREAEIDARAAEGMLPIVNSVQVKDNKVTAALARVRDRHGRYQHRALGKFPSGIVVPNDVFRQQRDTSQNPDIVFYHPIQRCMEHALDDLFKQQRREPFYLDYEDIYSALPRLQRNASGVIEYQIHKDDKGAVKQDPKAFLLVGMQRGFSNEPISILVSQYHKLHEKDG